MTTIPRTSRHIAARAFFAVAIAGAALLTRAVAARAQEIPPPSPNYQVIPAGSLIIPMDNTKQNVGIVFNLKSYGLVFNLLHNNIPVIWSIRSGKMKDAADFTATAARVSPSALAAATYDFAGGPFIIPKAYADSALRRITAFGNNVAVYRLTAPVTVDVRYTLHFKPRPYINTVNGGIAEKVMTAAGIPESVIAGSPGYVIASDATVNSGACYTILIEPHNTAPRVDAIRSFLLNGGNYYAQCAAVSYTENNTTYGRFLTTAGIVENNSSEVETFPNPDMAFSQFVGTVNNAPGGSEYDWSLNAGSSFLSSSSIHLLSTTTAMRYAAMEGSLSGGSAGGNVFYVGGHDNSGTNLVDINLQRMMLNAVMIPANRPGICGFEIPVPDLTISKTHTGSFLAGQNGTYTIAVSNIGTGATMDTVWVRDTIPAELRYVSATGSGWTFNVVGHVLTAYYVAPIAVGGSASFALTVSIPGSTDPGTITNYAHASGGGEINTSNNTASDAAQTLGPGVGVTPDSAAAIPRLPSNGVEYAYVFTVTNNGDAPSGYDLLAAFGDATTPFLTIDSITGLEVTRGTRADSAQLGTLQPGASATVTVWYRVADVAAGPTQLLSLTATSILNDKKTDVGSGFIQVVRPALTINKQVTPSGTQLPGTDLNYTVTVTNIGTDSAVAVVVVDSLPPQVIYKVGSITSTVPSGTTVNVEYSNDLGVTWTYAPVSEGCSAPVGYDACVNRIRWTMSSSLRYEDGLDTAVHVLVARLR